MSWESLVRMWVAEGFVLGKGKNTPENVAEGNLMELIHRNMLEAFEYDELGRVNTCKMHDIMRELALSVAKEEKFGAANDYGEMIQMDKDVRRLSLCGWKASTPLKVKFPHLRTLVAHGMISSPTMLTSISTESSYLTVLELQDSDINEVPAFIGNLFNLRYIGLRRTNVKSLPESIEKLSYLHTLDIKQTQIEKLPRGIVKVKKLRHLLADRFADKKQSEFRYFIGVEAPKGLSSMEELQTLETVQASKDLAEQLKKLMQLRSIWIDNVSAADCADLFATLSMMPLLSRLLISARDVNETLCLQALDPIPVSTKLHRLIVRGKWAAGTLKMLPQLKTLVLKRMPDVKLLEIGDGALPCIEGLYIVSLVQLDKVPQGIESLVSLKRLWMLNLHRDFITLWKTSGMHHKMEHVSEIRV
ncbi:disease resistance protein RPM1-like [Panicum miliaceum]|uniref:Disease resistance protein RPM1-like n=1 Tax=Panicum miliaceum TaxID=4540 RepID=A0A3L6Q2X7_PANMI|nr:disease resistance protein RPM1-like [Panicum miliaceum]